jgi:hypothetical protein
MLPEVTTTGRQLWTTCPSLRICEAGGSSPSERSPPLGGMGLLANNSLSSVCDRPGGDVRGLGYLLADDVGVDP